MNDQHHFHHDLALYANIEPLYKNTDSIPQTAGHGTLPSRREAFLDAHRLISSASHRSFVTVAF